MVRNFFEIPLFKWNMCMFRYNSLTYFYALIYLHRGTSWVFMEFCQQLQHVELHISINNNSKCRYLQTVEKKGFDLRPSRPHICVCLVGTFFIL